VGWEPPSVGCITLNTDGASKGNSGKAGGGGVFRGWKGEWLGGFAEGMGICSSVRAELRAVLQGLLVAKDKEFTKLMVKVDSMLVVGMLKGELKVNIRRHALVQQCKDLIDSSNWEVIISHCFREAS